MIALSRYKILIISIAMLQLLAIPVILWLADWQWALDNSFDGLDQFLFFITQTGTAITYALITCIVLVTVLSLMVSRKTPWMIVVITAGILLLGSQVLKTGLKSFYKEPRPYTAVLVEKGVNLETFYQEKRAVRKEIVQDALKDQTTMPSYLKKHWAKETGYSFPSGHTAFAVCWLVIFALFLPMNRRRDWAVFTVMFIWAAFMIISRIRFGMHFPIDVFVSTIYVPIMCVIYAKLTQCPKISLLYSFVTRR